MPSNARPKAAVTVPLEAEKREAVDKVARALQRDRSFIINEAIDAYLDTHRRQIEHIEEGLRQAERGDFATHEEVEAASRRC